MKCNLERIIARLSLQFSVQVDGETFRSVTDLKPLAEGHSPRQDVLYVAACSELMQYNGPVVSGPVLCIAAGGRQTGYDRGAFSTVIWVNASSFSTVYLALGKILYEEGEYSSELSEAAERFLHCKSFEELVNVGYAYLENPFAVFDEDGNVIAYTKQAGLRDPNWSSDAFIRKAYNNENWNLHTQAMYEIGRAHV